MKPHRKEEKAFFARPKKKADPLLRFARQRGEREKKHFFGKKGERKLRAFNNIFQERRKWEKEKKFPS